MTTMSIGKCTQVITEAAWPTSRFHFSSRTLKRLKLVSRKNVIGTRIFSLANLAIICSCTYVLCNNNIIDTHIHL